MIPLLWGYRFVQQQTFLSVCPNFRLPSFLASPLLLNKLPIWHRTISTYPRRVLTDDVREIYVQRRRPF